MNLNVHIGVGDTSLWINLPDYVVLMYSLYHSFRYRFLRSQDRELNKDCYPKLNFPEVYLLDGGYKPFFATQEAHCEPRSYTPMLHEDHAADLRHFRVKSKSWTAGETQRTSRRTKSRRSRTSIEFQKTIVRIKLSLFEGLFSITNLRNA